jgi:YidC/Oxa1 family membrane protein insertase
MNDTNRMVLTIALTAAILLGWYYFFRQKPPPQTEQPAPAAQTKTAKTQPAQSPESKPTSQPTATEGGPVAGDVEGKQTTLRAPGAIARFTTTGGALRSWKMTDPRYRELVNGKLVPVDLVQTEAGKGPWPLTVTVPSGDFAVPERADFKVVRADSREVLYRWESNKVRMDKHFVVDPKRPLLWMTVSVRNLTQGELKGRLQVNLYNHQEGQGKAGFANPYPKIATILCHVNGELFRRSAGAIRGENGGCSAAGCGMGEGPVTKTGQAGWVGADNRYFMTALVPKDKDETRRCELELKQDNLIAARMQLPEQKIAAGKVISRRFAVFVGPKDLGALDTVKTSDGERAGLAESIEFGWFAVLCRPMLWLLKVFYGWFGNWGIAIILLTVVVKLLTLYWTQKSMRSMKQMQKLKPKIDELREKLKGDKERLNQEMMALYKIHKVNPLGGCLPMVIQMPIWFALYRTLGNAVELYRSSFVGWIADLTAPDPYYVLPIAMGISMYAQQAITPQPMEGTQAKIFKYFMPGMFTFMMLWLPSGLTLYIFVNTLLTMVHQWYMNKTDPVETGKPASPATGTSQQRSGGGADRPDGRPRARRRKKRNKGH